MPYEMLTDVEKQDATVKFENLFEKLNAYFKKNNMPELNYQEEKAKLEQRLNDPKMVARYRLSKEIKDLKKAKAEAYEIAKKAIVGDQKDLGIKNNHLSRTIEYLMKTDNTQESNEYNIKLLNSYIKDPEGFTRERLKNIMTYDPTELINIGDDKLKILEFYKNNMAFCQECNDFASSSIIDHLDPPLSKEFKAADLAIANFTESVHFGAMISPESDSLEFFAYPEFSAELNDKLFHDTTKIFGRGNTTKEQKTVLQYRGTTSVNLHKPLSSLADKMKAKGLVVDKNLFLKYKAYEVNPQTKEIKEVRISDYLENKPNVKIALRSPDEIERLVRFAPEGFKDKVHNAFLDKFNQKTNRSNYSYEEINNKMKGGFFAKIFRRPSKEFNAYMKALKAYNDPKDVDYLNKSRLSKAGNDYLKHVENNGGLDVNNMNSTRKMRFNLVKNTMDTFEEMNHEKVEDKLYNEVYNNVIKEPAFKENENDIIIDNSIKNDIIKENEIQTEDINEITNE